MTNPDVTAAASDAVRAAAERLRQLKTTSEAVVYIDHPLFLAGFSFAKAIAYDKSLLADAYLATVAADDGEPLASRVLAMCQKRGWSLHWTARGAYLHLEASELIESLRGKRGTPINEAADVLLVLMSITESNGIPWSEVETQASATVDRLMEAPRYAGEEYIALQPSGQEQGK